MMHLGIAEIKEKNMFEIMIFNVFFIYYVCRRFIMKKKLLYVKNFDYEIWKFHDNDTAPFKGHSQRYWYEIVIALSGIVGLQYGKDIFYLKKDDLFCFDLGTEACLSIASILQYAREGYNGVLNVFPFTCMPSMTTAAIVKPFMTAQGVPYLDTPYDSSFQPGREAAIRTFMYQAHQHFKRHGRKNHNH